MTKPTKRPNSWGNDERYKILEELVKRGEMDIFACSIQAGFSNQTARTHSRHPFLLDIQEKNLTNLVKTCQITALNRMLMTMQSGKTEAIQLKAADMAARHTGLKELIMPKEAGNDPKALSLDQLKVLSKQLDVVIQEGTKNERVIEHVASPNEEIDDLLL